jgi:hypothetical protein
MYKIRIDKYVLFSLHCTTTNMLTIITYFLVHCFCIDTKRLQKKWTLLSFPYMICCISIGLKNFKDISISIKSSFVVPVHFSMTQRYKKKIYKPVFSLHFLSSLFVRPSTFHILIFSSETTGPIATKLWWNGLWMAPFQNCVRCSRLPTKMAAKLKIEKRGD